MTFTRADLLADIIDEELEAIEELSSTAVDQTIAEQVGKVEDYTLRYVVSDERLKRLTRALCLYELALLRSVKIAEKRKDKYDEAMKELRDIRDGKFPDLVQKDPLPEDVQPYSGRWGSNPKFKTR